MPYFSFSPARRDGVPPGMTDRRVAPINARAGVSSGGPGSPLTIIARQAGGMIRAFRPPTYQPSLFTPSARSTS